MLVPLMGGIHEAPRPDGFRWHYIHTKFHKEGRYTYRHTDSKVI
jgi:hypothetical protein